jgi:hypothetical protein
MAVRSEVAGFIIDPLIRSAKRASERGRSAKQ